MGFSTIALTTSALLAATPMAGTVGAVDVLAQTGAAQPGTIQRDVAQQNQQHLTAVADVQGLFSFTQETVTPNQTIKQVFQKTSAALCNVIAAQRSFLDAFLISVGGDVPSPYEATVAQLVEEQGATVQLMGCSCTANSAGGWAVANARVSGVSIEAIAAQAGL